MDSRESEDKRSGPVTRSKRLASGKGGIDAFQLAASAKLQKGLNYVATPRESIKKNKRKLENQAAAATVNGTKDGDTGSEDGESPNKKNRQDAEGAVGDEGDETEMDVEESAGEMQNNEDQRMGIIKDNVVDLQSIYKGPFGDVNLSPRVELGERCRPSLGVNQDPDWMKSKKATPAAKAPASPTKSATHIVSPVNRHDAPTHTQSTMADYRRKMEDKPPSAASSLDISKVNHLSQSVYPRQRTNNIPRSGTVHPKKSEDVQKIVATKTHPRNSSRGFTWCWYGLVLVVLFMSATLLTYKILPLLQDMASGGRHPSRAVKPEKFTDHLSILATQFPSQRHELWKMSRIHLEKHLKTARPTEPVSLIFTAGQKAEGTLQCLAKGLASSFSSALNASFLHIDGTSKAGQNSDDVKLDIDRQLQAAFEGEKPVAIIHRLEELPSGSTLIFYRYCDHENAAYKRVFLLFTVLLPQDEIQGEKGLKEVEEMVQDYLKEKLVGSTNDGAFDKMNNDKFSGLWSRISHLVLPVVSEVEVEKKGC